MSYAGKRTQTPSSSRGPLSCLEMRPRLNEKLRVCPRNLANYRGSCQATMHIFVPTACSLAASIKPLMRNLSCFAVANFMCSAAG
jgi:hypothetical protein